MEKGVSMMLATIRLQLVLALLVWAASAVAGAGGVLY